MQPMCLFAINKSGKALPVYDVDKGKQVGIINNREAFVYDGGESGQYLYFLSPTGFIQANIGLERDLEYDEFASCLNYPYSEEVIDGTSYKIFKMRKTKKIYKGDGSEWGTVAAGMFVATNSDKIGINNPTWKLINYVKNTSSKWIKVSGAGYEHGFVDTGLDTSSGYGTVAFYGSW